MLLDLTNCVFFFKILVYDKLEIYCLYGEGTHDQSRHHNIGESKKFDKTEHHQLKTFEAKHFEGCGMCFWNYRFFKNKRIPEKEFLHSNVAKKCSGIIKSKK
jgi:hypothetical protein